MIQSMTGFGSAESGGFKVEIRSLNHKHNEISIKMPSFLIEQDMSVRNLIKSRFQRGKFDVNVTLTDRQKSKIKANKELARELYEAFQDLKAELNLAGNIDLNSLVIFRELIITDDSEYNQEIFLSVLETAIMRLLEMRVKEGESLKKDIEVIITNLKNRYELLKTITTNSAQAQRDNIIKKINELLSSLPVDEVRLNQEIAFIAQKSDITEELSRLKSHIKHLESVLSGEDAVGRKLDFILQEILREANTIASKTEILDVINQVIEIKTEVEKLRELAQNLQ